MVLWLCPEPFRPDWIAYINERRIDPFTVLKSKSITLVNTKPRLGVEIQQCRASETFWPVWIQKNNQMDSCHIILTRCIKYFGFNSLSTTKTASVRLGRELAASGSTQESASIELNRRSFSDTDPSTYSKLALKQQ